MRFSPFVIELLTQKSGYEIRLPRDSELLALDIESATGEHIGVNTLKRLLGFIADERCPRTSTLDIVAIYLGFSDWRTLAYIIHDNTFSTRIYVNETRIIRKCFDRNN